MILSFGTNVVITHFIIMLVLLYKVYTYIQDSETTFQFLLLRELRLKYYSIISQSSPNSSKWGVSKLKFYTGNYMPCTSIVGVTAVLKK